MHYFDPRVETPWYLALSGIGGSALAMPTAAEARGK